MARVAAKLGDPFANLALHGLWWLVSEPPGTAPYQNFALRHAGIIQAALTPQGNRYWVAFGLFRVTSLQVIGTDRDRNCVALSGIYDRQTIQFDFGHHTLYKALLGAKKTKRRPKCSVPNGTLNC